MHFAIMRTDYVWEIYLQFGIEKYSSSSDLLLKFLITSFLMSLLALDEFLEIDPDDPAAVKLDFFGVSTSIFVSTIIFTCLLNKLLLFVARCFFVLFLKILLYIQHLSHPTSCADDTGDGIE